MPILDTVTIDTTSSVASIRNLQNELVSLQGQALSTQNALNSLTTSSNTTGNALNSLTPAANSGGNALNSLNKQVQPNVDSMGRLTDQVHGLITAITSLAGAGVLGALLMGVGEVAARTEVLNTVMLITAKNVHQTASDMEVQVQKTKQLGITTQEAISSVLQFSQAQLKISETSKLARAAQDLAVVAGMNSSQAFATLTQAIQVQQPILLRQFHIVTGLQQIYSEYAATINKTGKTLDEAEKKQAFLNKILTQAETVAGAYEASMNDVGKQMGSFARYVQEAEQALGKALLPAMLTVVLAARDFLEWFNQLNPIIQTFITAMLAGVAAIVLFGTVTKTLMALGVGQWFAGAAVYVSTFIEALAIGEIGLAGEALMALLGPLGLIAIAIGAVVAAYIIWTNVTKLHTQETFEEAAEIKGNIQNMTVLADRVEALAHKTRLTAGELAEYNKKLQDLHDLNPKLVGGFDALTGRMTVQKEALRQLTEEQYRHIRSRQEEIKLDVVAIQAQKASLDSQKKMMEGFRERALAELKLKGVTEDQARERARSMALGIWGGGGADNAIMQMMDAEKSLRAINTEMKGVNASLKTAQDQADSLDMSAPFRAASRAADEMAVKLLKANAGLKDAADPTAVAKAQIAFDKLVKSAGATKEFNAFKESATKGADDVREAFNKLNEKLEEHRAKEAKLAEQYKKDFDSTVQKLQGFDPHSKAGFAALSQELGKASADHAKYNAVLNAGNSIVQNWMKLSEGQKKVLGLTAAEQNRLNYAVDQFKARKADEAMKAWAKAADTALTSLEALTDKGLNKLNADLEKSRSSFDDKWVAAHDKNAEETFKTDQELSEKILALTGTELEQKLAANDKYYDNLKQANFKRIDDLEKLYKEEHETTNKIISDTERELLAEVDKWEKKFISAEAYYTALKGLEDAQKLEDSKQKDEAIARSTGEFSTRIAAVKATIIATAQAQREANDQQLADRKGLLTKEEQAIKDANKRIEVVHKITNAAIKHDNEMLFQWLKSELGQWVTAIGTNLFQALVGVKSWKDAFMAIWQSIYQSLISLFGKIVEKWVASLFIMKSAEQAANLGGSAAGGGAGGSGIGGFASSSIGGGLIGGGAGAVVGGLVGSYVGGRTHSATKGGLAGMGAGAATGATVGGMLGGPWGAAIGGIIGGVYGLYSGIKAARAEMHAVQKARDEYVKTAGGFEELSKKVIAAGGSIADLNKLMNAKTIEDYDAAMKALNATFELDEVKKARDKFIEAAGGLDKLKKSAESVGFDLDKLFNAKTVDEYNAAVDELNKALEHQKKLLESLSKIGEATTMRTEGLMGSVDRLFSDRMDKLGKSAKDKLTAAFEKAKKEGFEGEESDFLRQAVGKANQKGGALPPGFSKKDLDELNEKLKPLAEEFESIGRAAKMTFSMILKQTGDVNLAMDAISPALDNLIKLQKDLGFAADDGLQHLIDLRKTINTNKDVVTSLEGIKMTLDAMTEAGIDDQSMFTNLGMSAKRQMDILHDRNIDVGQSLMIMQPTLQALWEAQQKFHYTTDAATQAMIDQAVAAGVVGEHQKDVNNQILDVLKLIATTLGATIPDAYAATGAAAADAAKKTEEASKKTEDTAAATDEAAAHVGKYKDEWVTKGPIIIGQVNDVTTSVDGVASATDGTVNGLEASKRAFESWRNTGVAAANDVYDAIHKVAVGESPGGIKEIPLKLADSIMSFKEFRATGVDSARAVSRAVDDMKIHSSKGAPAPESGNSTTYVTHEHNVQVNALDNANMEEAFRNKIWPEMDKHFESNTDGSAVKVARHVGKYAARGR